MIALINFCVLKYNIDPEKAREDTESIVKLAAECASFKGEKIKRELRKLFKANYWTELEQKKHLGIFKKRKLGVFDKYVDANGPESIALLEKIVDGALWIEQEGFSEIIRNDHEGWKSLSVQEITKEGWLLTLPYKHRKQQNSSDSELEEDTPQTALLKVPQKLKILGKVGMKFDGMGLRKRGGIWQPFGLYIHEDVCYGVNQ
jgi:hypothetical protein